MKRCGVFLLTTLLLGPAGQALMAPPVAHAEVTQDPPEKVMVGMMEATKNRSYDDFLVDANDDVRANLSQQMFQAVCNQVAPRLKQGYKTRFLAKLKQTGQTVYLWKLEFADGKDEALIHMVVKDKKVAGILLQ